jgi:Undecaprenyl-phosphate glucose phosphotransferase
MANVSDYWPGSVIPARTAPAEEADVTSRGIMSPMDVTDAKDAYLGRPILAEPLPRAGRWQPRALSLPIITGLMQLFDAAALLLTSWIVGSLSVARLAEPLRPQTHVLTALLAGVATFYGLYRAGAYSPGRLKQISHQMSAVISALLVGAVTLSACLLLLQDAASLPDVLIDWGLSCGVILTGLRLTFHAVLRRWFDAGLLAQRIAVIGDPAISARLLARLGEGDDYRVIGLFNDQPGPLGSQAFQKSASDLLEISKQTPVDGIVVALPLSEAERIAQIRTAVASIVADIYLVSDALWLPESRRSSEHLLMAIERPLKDWRALQKLLLDQVIAMMALVTLLPLLLAIAVLIKLDSPGPVFFRQPRIGFNNQVFRIYKFRTMYHHMADLLADCQTTRGDARITRLGKWLRRFSIDELPQLLNVLQGNMSLVGPRPHAPNTKAAGKLFEVVVPGYAARHRVKPGITGWAQVNGWRGETQTTEQIRKRVELDLEYIQNWSVGLDLKILMLTVLREFVSPNAF